MPSETRLEDLTVRRQLVARDLQETLNYAFVDAGLLSHWHLHQDVVALASAGRRG